MTLNDFKMKYRSLTSIEYMTTDVRLEIPESIAMLHNNKFSVDDTGRTIELGDLIAIAPNMTTNVLLGIVIGFNPKSIRVLTIGQKGTSSITSAPGEVAIIFKKSANLVD